VAGGDVGEDKIAFAGPGGDGLRGDGDVVVGVDVDEEFHFEGGSGLLIFNRR
jgi:hypothetical protein